MALPAPPSQPQRVVVQFPPRTVIPIALPKPAPEPYPWWALLVWLGLLAATTLLLSFYAVFVLQPTYFPPSLAPIDYAEGGANLRVFVSQPARISVGEEAEFSLTVLNQNDDLISGELVLVFDGSMPVHVTSETGNALAFSTLPKNALASTRVTFVVPQRDRSALDYALVLRPENAPERQLLQQSIQMSPLPRINAVSAAFGGMLLAAFFGLLQVPWDMLKKRLMPK